MTKAKSTKRALLMSALALVMCFSMLIGSTFAWFTDSVTSGNNKIVSGNLDAKLSFSTWDEVTNTWGDYQEVTSDTVVFGKDAKYEPGYTEVVKFKVENLGSLAFKYQLGMHVSKETPSTNVYGDEFYLSDYIKVGVADYVPGITDRATAAEYATKDISEATNLAVITTELPWGDVLVSPCILFPAGTVMADTPQDVAEWVFVIHMPTTVGNEANHKTGVEAPSIEFGVNLIAAQYNYEKDSFDNQYDKDAKYPGEVATADELAAALANNESVKLLNDIVLTGEWTPIGNEDEGIYYTGTLDGNGHTISGLSVTSGDYVALISAAKDATIKNLTVEGSVAGENAAGVVARVEGNTTIENVTSNVTVKGTTKAGGITCNVTNSEKTVFINCVNNGAVSGGNNGIGGIIGYVNNDAYVEIIACENNANITSDNNKYAGAAVGYAAGTSKGTVVGMKNTGTVTGTLLNDGRFLKYDDTVLCGYVGTIGNWTSALLATPENVQSVIDNALEGATVQLSAGKYGTIVAKSNITIQGVTGAVVDCVNLNGASNVNLVKIHFDAAGAQGAYDKTGTRRTYANIISGSKDTAVGARNIVIDGCTFTGKFENAGAAIAFADRSRPTGGSGNVTVKNCTFNTENANYDVYGYYTGATGMAFTFESNTFASACAGRSIYLGKLATSEAIVVKGNAFMTKASIENSVTIQAHSATYTPTLDAADNTFGG